MTGSEISGNAPVVSVIIPAYRAVQTIAATLDSVLSQTFTEHEIVVVNDGSPDSGELEEALQPYRGRIVYLRQENQGTSGARNTGIRAAHGKYVAFLDADDTWDPENLGAQLRLIETDPSIAVVYADARIIGDVPEAGKTVMDLCPSSGEVTLERLITRECTVHLCVSLCRREAVLAAGLFDPQFRRAEDIDLWLRIIAAGGRIAYQKRVLGCYRKSPDSLSADSAAMLEAFLKVLEKTARDARLSAAQKAVVERQILVERASLELQQGRKAFLEGHPEAAAELLAKANSRRKSLKLTAAVVLLRVAPGFLRTLYEWRYRRIYKLKTQS